MTLRCLAGLWMVASAIAPTTATANDNIRVDRQMFVEHVVTDLNGRARTVLASSDRLAPGDRLIVVINWSNAGNRPVKGLALTNAVRHDVDPDLSDPHMIVSVDRGAHWGRLDQLWLPTPLGGTRRATPCDVTHIRWTMAQPVSPGETGRLSYRAIAR